MAAVVGIGSGRDVSKYTRHGNYYYYNNCKTQEKSNNAIVIKIMYVSN